MKSLRCALFVAVLFPWIARAGVRCDFRTVISSPSYSYAGTLMLDGDQSRVDFTAGEHPIFNPHTSVITRKGGAEIVIIDHVRRTWFRRTSKGLGGHLSTSRGITPATTATDAVVKSERNGDQHHVHVSYAITTEVEGEKLPATIELDVLSDLASPIHDRQRAFPWGLQFGAKTGFDAIDKVIAKHMPSLLPVRQVVTASRQLQGGPVVSETITTTLSNVTDAPIPANVFYPPPGYRFEAPVFQFGE
ncbi:MAG: hypothetical protein M3Q69_15365 [Acidobacteriota bacterium]|nr:hypothetical protein [Acidobacteriota bacterium]